IGKALCAASVGVFFCFSADSVFHGKDLSVWISALRIDSNKTVLLPIYWEKGVMAPAGIITFLGDDSVFIHKWPFSAISASITLKT
ncbi:MAG: hypothetical protein WB818_17835, partial [Desulfobacterales bacterium]